MDEGKRLFEGHEGGGDETGEEAEGEGDAEADAESSPGENERRSQAAEIEEPGADVGAAPGEHDTGGEA